LRQKPFQIHTTIISFGAKIQKLQKGNAEELKELTGYTVREERFIRSTEARE
jgi:hypothetical protein